MPENHHGRKLREFIRLNEINVDRDVIPKLEGTMSKPTFYRLYTLDRIKPEYINALLKAGIDFLGQSPTTKLRSDLQFPQKESGLSERVRQLEQQLAQVQSALLDLYSRIPKQG